MLNASINERLRTTEMAGARILAFKPPTKLAIATPKISFYLANKINLNNQKNKLLT
ncbi:hypothetical protein EMIT0347P_60199 [Pseudomonas sp. IT-347P]